MLDLFSSERPSCVFARNYEETEIVFYKTEQGHVHLTEFEVDLFSFFLKYMLFSWILPQPLFFHQPSFPIKLYIFMILIEIPDNAENKLHCVQSTLPAPAQWLRGKTAVLLAHPAAFNLSARGVWF